jgi:hypothetical protein
MNVMTNKEKIEEIRKKSYELIEARDKALSQAGRSVLVQWAAKLSDLTLSLYAKRIALLQLKDPDAQLDFVVPSWVKLTIFLMIAYIAYGQVIR